jgi:hypothetical protein
MAGGADVQGGNKRKRDAAGKHSAGKGGGGDGGVKRNKSYDATAPRGGGGGGQPVTARDKRVAAKVPPLVPACFSVQFAGA